MTYRNTQEAYRDALEMERCSILADEEDERDLPAHKRKDYAERMYDAADEARKEAREAGE